MWLEIAQKCMINFGKANYLLWWNIQNYTNHTHHKVTLNKLWVKVNEMLNTEVNSQIRTHTCTQHVCVNSSPFIIIDQSFSNQRLNHMTTLLFTSGDHYLTRWFLQKLFFSPSITHTELWMTVTDTHTPSVHTHTRTLATEKQSTGFPHCCIKKSSQDEASAVASTRRVFQCKHVNELLVAVKWKRCITSLTNQQKWPLAKCVHN